ncbi:unnamed protein product [Coregonus sp. 'balchen']|nr:unnamed protein product [Coregonus sp. 'balchen']
MSRYWGLRLPDNPALREAVKGAVFTSWFAGSSNLGASLGAEGEREVCFGMFSFYIKVKLCTD